MTGQPNRRTTTMSEKLRIVELLKMHTTKTDDGVEYARGWNDESVAKAVNADLNGNHVRGIRNEVFGQLRPGPGSRLSLFALATQFNKLCDRLGEPSLKVDVSSGNGIAHD